MDFIRESKKRPKLTSELNVTAEVIKPKILSTAPPLKPVKWNLNVLLIIGFIIFMVFFLYNCKYGFFHTTELEPYAFS